MPAKGARLDLSQRSTTKSHRWKGAPPLQGQHHEYLERQLESFGQDVRRNDIDEQMRVIAKQLTAVEVHAIAGYCAKKPAPLQLSP